MSVHYDKDTVDRVRQSDMTDFFGRYKGFSFKMQGADFRCVEHNSLIVKGDKRRWFWNSRGVGGSGVIDYLIKVENMTFPEAVASAQNAVGVSVASNQIIEARRKILLSLPEKGCIPYSRMYNYLCKQRGIDTSIVSKLMQERKIFQDNRGNVVFVEYDEKNIPRYASIRGTGEKQFRIDCDGSDKRYSFHIKGINTKTLYVFESPIDALSHATLENIRLNNSQAWLEMSRLTLGGTSSVAMDGYLSRNKEVNKLVLCLDNDEAGNEATDKLIEKYSGKGFETLRFLPKGKDFNDELVDYRKNKVVELKSSRANEIAL